MARDGVHDGLHVAFLGLEGKVFPIFRPLSNDQRVALVGDALPDFLGDEGMEGMQQPQNLVKHVHQHLNRGLLADRILGVQPRLVSSIYQSQ